MKYEKVHTVNDYWDGPLIGVADYKGKPHRFELIFDENEDDYSTEYELQQISETEFKLIIQSWNLWIKWKNKKDRTKDEQNSHPVLPEDRKEYEKIVAKLKVLTETNKFPIFKVKGYFNRIGPEHHDFEVHWSIDNN